MAVFRDPTKPIEGVTSLFFNDTYDPKFAQEHAFKYYSQTYYRCLRSQVEGCGLGFISGPMKEFKLDFDFNRTCGFPHRTYTVRVQNTFLHNCIKTAAVVTDPKDFRTFTLQPDYTNTTDFLNDIGRSEEEKRFTTRLGDHLYTMWDTFTMTTRFSSGLLFFVGDRLYSQIRIVPCKQYTYFCIFPEEDTEIGLPEDYIKQLIADNATWSIYVQRPSAFYFHEGELSDFISQDGVDLSQFTGKYDQMYTKYRSVKANAYQLFLSSYDPEVSNLLLDMTFTQKEEKNDKVYFTFPYEYWYNIQNIKGKVMVWIINMDQIYLQSDLGMNRIFQIPIYDELKDEDGNVFMRKSTPTPPENIRVYKKSPSGGVMTPMPDAVIRLYYPNVYEIEADSVPANENIWINVYNADNGFYFNNPIQTFMDYADSHEDDNEKYAGLVIRDELPKVLQDYIPSVIEYSVADYLANADYSSGGSFDDQPDQYPLRKIIEMVNDNPEFNKDLFIDVRKQLNDHDLFEYTIVMRDHPHIRERVVKDTSQFIEGDPDNTQAYKFRVDMIWLAVDMSCQEGYPFQIYIDGKIFASPYTYRRGSMTYIFIPASFVTEDSIINLVVMTQDRDTSYALADPIRFEMLNETQEFPFPFSHFGARNLIFYDADTQVRYPSTYFTFHLYYNLESAHIMTFTIDDMGKKSDPLFLKTTEKDDDGADTDEHLFVVTGPGSSVMTYVGTFYKNIETRIARHQLSLGANPEIMENAVMDNKGQIKAPQYQTEFDSERIWFALEAPKTYGFIYPTRLMISTEIGLDDEETDEFDCYTEMDEKGVVRMYIYVPKDLVELEGGAATISFDVILAKADTIMHKLVNYETAPEIRISCTNEQALNKNICIVSVDAYQSQIWDPAHSHEDYYDWPLFKFEASKERIRMWRLNTNYLGTYVPPEEFTATFGEKYGDPVTFRLKAPDTVDPESGETIPGGDIHATDRYLIEYLPYHQRVVYTKDNTSEGNYGAEPKEVIDMEDHIQRPLSFVNYEFFQNGLRMDQNMISIVTEHKYRYKRSEQRSGIMRLVERSHDADAWGNSARLQRTLEDRLYDEVPEFATYLRNLRDQSFQA